MLSGCTQGIGVGIKEKSRKREKTTQVVLAVPRAGMGLIGFAVSDYTCNMHVIQAESDSEKGQIKAEL